MPYSIEKVKGGYKVFKNEKYGVKEERRVPFSNKPLTKKVAQKQRIAIALSEAMNGEGRSTLIKTGKSVGSYFI